jgi:Protein of unknown function (DUF3455)
MTPLLFAAALAALAGVGRPSEAADVSSLKPPADARLLLRAAATGVQIYVCGAQGSGVAWTLKAPEAMLRDAGGKQIGRHFAGPSWQANDGSTVVGEVVARADAPIRDAIPWLLLRAKSHSGRGEFTKITFIQRIDTAGGIAPAAGCDDKAQGTEVRVSYSANYLFYAAK